MGGEQVCGAYFNLLARVCFRELRMVAAVRALECVATLIVVPGLRVLAPIFERLAERETQVVSIDEMRGRRGFRGLHVLYLLSLETIRLEIGKAPIRIAKVRPYRRGGSIGIDGLLPAPDGLE